MCTSNRGSGDANDTWITGDYSTDLSIAAEQKGIVRERLQPDRNTVVIDERREGELPGGQDETEKNTRQRWMKTAAVHGSILTAPAPAVKI